MVVFGEKIGQKTSFDVDEVDRCGVYFARGGCRGWYSVVTGMGD